MDEIWLNLVHARADVTLTLGFVLAVGITVHILLTKREVASAVGWIGLVWFAPVLGAATYAMFGINRVRRRARLMRARDHHPAVRRRRIPEAAEGLVGLARGIGRITRRRLADATVAEIYRNGDEAYPAMLAAIAGARTSIGLSSYIFRDDLWGGRFIDALIEAHRRGVAVRVLIDGIGGGWLRSATYHRLRRSGLTAARFMHSIWPWRMPFVNLRSHKKILVIDGRLGFTGGMNIADENVMQTRPKVPVQDLHFRLQGPVVAQLVGAFADDWAFVTGEELEGEAWFPVITDPGACPGRVIDSGPDEDVEKVEYAALQAIACARTAIAVMTPYFLPDDRLITALALAAQRGVAVDVVLPEQGNHILVDWATRANIGPLLDAGAHVWQSPPPFHHSKLMVVDSEWCLIGSANWDIRSLRLNFELCLEVYDPALAQRLEGLMQESRGSALTKSVLDARSLVHRLRDAGARLLLPYL